MSIKTNQAERSETRVSSEVSFSMNYRKGYKFYSAGDKAFLLFVNIVLVLAGLVVLYPLVYITSMSFSSITAVQSGQVWLWPVNPTLNGYTAVFKNENIVSGYLNSAFYMAAGTVVNVFMTMICAYPLSRRNFKAKGVFMFLMTVTMFFSGGLIPTYMLVNSLGMIDTRLAMIIPSAMSVWNVIIARTFIRANISDELREAAQLDGCNDITYLWKIVMPLSKAIIAVVALFCAVGFWNSYFSALLYLRDKAKLPLQIILREILILNDINQKMATSAIDTNELAQRLALKELLKYSLIIVASVPMLIMYPLVQKHFVKGVMLGSLKG